MLFTRRHIVVGAPHDQPPAVGRHHLLRERFAPRLLGQPPRHEERLDGREVDDAAQLVKRDNRIPQIDLRGVLEAVVGRPVLRYGHRASLRARRRPI